MNTTQCPHCHASIQAELVYCPYCLTRQTATFRPKEVKRDPYQILQVSKTARPEAIEAAYRRLARIYHPDLNPNAEAQSRMKDINWARDILRDPIQRLDWDVRQGAAQREAARRPAAAPSSAPASAAQPEPRPSAGAPPSRRQQPVRLPLLAWIVLAAIGLALSVALLPRANPAALAATATGPAVTVAALELAVPTSSPFTPAPRQNPLRAGGCLLWSEVGQAQIGQDICVFGIVALNEPRAGSTPTVLQFSQTWTDFKVQDFNRSYAELIPGTCVLVRGRVIDNVSFLMISPSNTPNSVSLYPNAADCL